MKFYKTKMPLKWRRLKAWTIIFYKIRTEVNNYKKDAYLQG